MTILMTCCGLNDEDGAFPRHVILKDGTSVADMVLSEPLDNGRMYRNSDFDNVAK